MYSGCPYFFSLHATNQATTNCITTSVVRYAKPASEVCCFFKINIADW